MAYRVILLLSGGTGQRMGADVPKQYIRAAGEMIITHCMERLLSYGKFDAMVIVAADMWQDTILKECRGLMDEGPLSDDAGEGDLWPAEPVGQRFRGFAAPGRNRAESIYHGLRLISDFAPEDTVVMVHDAVRPLVSDEQLEACFMACEAHDGAMPVLPMKDTVYLSRDGISVSELLPREMIFAGQAPEAFALKKYLQAYEALLPDRILRINGSTEPAIMAGMDIAMIPGDESNFKITTPEDLDRFRLIAGRKGEGHEV